MSSSPLARTVRGSGPGLLLAHGAGGSAEGNYGPITDGLAEHRTVVAPDYPGTGRTPRATAPLTLDGLADALVGAAVEEGLETFAVAGYSLGAPVAVRAAVRHPERVTALVLTAGFARPNPRLLLALRVWRELYEAGDAERTAAVLTLSAAAVPAVDRLGQDELDLAVKTGAATLPPGTPEHLDLASRADVSGDLARVAVPTLVVSTTLDNLVTPHLHRELADGIPGARFAELRAGHLPWAEAPEEWLGLILGFLDEHRP
ncbi:3-oxoadipate enol-lactonase [Streptomyces capparidis]